jgi:hypothetical protein
MESKQSAWNKNKPLRAKEELENKKRDLVMLLRWVLKHYSTSTDIEGFFMWENPLGKEFDSIQVVDHYLKENL